MASVLTGLSVALPLRKVLMGFAGSSLAGSALVHGVTVDFLGELLKANLAAGPALVVLLVFGSIASWLLSLTQKKARPPITNIGAKNKPSSTITAKITIDEPLD